jgi:hypothetical protein
MADWTGGDGGLLAAAHELVEEAVALLGGAAPREWRASAARRFGEELDRAAQQAAGLGEELALAGEAVRTHQVRLAAARAALAPYPSGPAWSFPAPGGSLPLAPGVVCTGRPPSGVVAASSAAR